MPTTQLATELAKQSWIHINYVGMVDCRSDAMTVVELPQGSRNRPQVRWKLIAQGRRGGTGPGNSARPFSRSARYQRMVEAWLSVGYILLFVILVFAIYLWRSGRPVSAIAALILGLPLWFGWEYARPTWTIGTISGTEVRRSDPDAVGNTSDIEYIFMRNRSDRGVELVNEDSWWWLKRNSERVFNDAKTAQLRNTQVTVMWSRWRSTLLSKYPNAISIGPAGSWPLWSWRTLSFYSLSAILWLGYFLGFGRLRNLPASGTRSGKRLAASATDKHPA